MTHPVQDTENEEADQRNLNENPSKFGDDSTEDEVLFANLTCFGLLFIVFGVGVFLYDVFADIYVAYLYFVGSWWTEFTLTTISILLPSVVVALFRFRGNQVHASKITGTAKFFDFVATFLQLMPLLLCAEYFWYSVNAYFYGRRISCWGRKKLNSDWFKERVIWLLGGIAIIRLIESFIEAIPQISLQSYIAINQLNDPNGPMRGEISWGAIQSVATSLVSCSWSICFAFMTFAYGSPITTKDTIPIPRLFIMFFGYFGIISARLFSLEYLLVTSVPVFLIVCLSHWLVVLIWIHIDDHFIHCIEFKFVRLTVNVFRAFSFLFVFAYIVPKRFEVMKRFWGAHILMLIENLVITVFCYAYGSSFGGYISYKVFSVDALCLIVIPQLIFGLGLVCLVVQNVKWDEVEVEDGNGREERIQVIRKLLIRVMGMTVDLETLGGTNARAKSLVEATTQV